MPADVAPAPRRRPAAVTILAAIQIVTALMLAIIAAALMLDPAATLPVIGGVVLASDALAIAAVGVAAVYTAMAVLELAAAVALLRLRRLGWTLTMLLAGASLASSIATWWFSGEVPTASMLLGVATVLYLNQRQVRAAFGIGATAARCRPRGASAADDGRPRAAPPVRAGHPLHPRASSSSRWRSTRTSRTATCGRWTPRRRRDARSRRSGEVTARRPARLAAARPGPVAVPAVRAGAAVGRRARPGQGPRRSGRRFSAPSRLARVGIVARLIDAGFDLSLLVRGTVPGGTVAAAEVKYARDPGGGPALLLPRPRRPPRRLDDLPLPLLLRDERLALVVRGRQRPRGRLGAVLRVPRGARRRHRRPRSGSPARPTTRSGPTCGAAGTTRSSSVRATTRSSSPAPAPTPPTSSPASTCCRSRSGCRGGARAPRRRSGVLVRRRSGRATAASPGRRRWARSRSWTTHAATGWRWARAGTGVDADPHRRRRRHGSAAIDGLFGLDTKDRMAGERAPAGPKFARDGRPRQSWIDPIAFAGLAPTPPSRRGRRAGRTERRPRRRACERSRRRIAEPDARPATRRAGRRRPACRSLRARRSPAPRRRETATSRSCADLRIAGGGPPRRDRRQRGRSWSASRAASPATPARTCATSSTRRTLD